MWNYLTSIGSRQIHLPFFSFGLDKIMHFTTIIIIGIFLNILFKRKFPEIIIGILIFISILKELYDLLVRNTEFGFYDIFADFLGIITFVLIFIILIPIMNGGKGNKKKK